MHRGTVGVLVIALADLCSACAYVEAYRPAWTYPSPPQRTYYSSSRHHAHSARNHRHQSSAEASADSAEPATGDRPATEDRAVTESTRPAPAVASNPPVSMSLAGDSGDRERAQQLLGNAEANLGRARRHHLTQSQKATYERANQLATRARHALADNDCAAASSLASKASSLAAGISGQ
jgi:hypothetical protein